MYNYTSELDKLLSKLEIQFPDKPYSRIMEESKYNKIFALRDQITPYKFNYIGSWKE